MIPAPSRPLSRRKQEEGSNDQAVDTNREETSAFRLFEAAMFSATEPLKAEISTLKNSLQITEAALEDIKTKLAAVEKERDDLKQEVGSLDAAFKNALEIKEAALEDIKTKLAATEKERDNLKQESGSGGAAFKSFTLSCLRLFTRSAPSDIKLQCLLEVLNRFRTENLSMAGAEPWTAQDFPELYHEEYFSDTSLNLQQLLAHVLRSDNE